MNRLVKAAQDRVPYILIGALLISLVILALAYVSWGPQPSLSQYATFATLKSTDRVTVVSPHLDDETLGVGGLIAQARAQGVPVSVIFMTNGDDNPIGADLQLRTGYATPQDLIKSGTLRQQEALSALGKLGVQSSDIYFLGLPDRSLSKLLLPQYATKPYTAPGTLQNSSPYSLTYIKNLAYSGTATQNALDQAVKQTNPTIVLTTLPEDLHQDHQATAVFVQRLMPQIPNATLDYFLIHYHKYPRPRGINSNEPLLPPAGLQNRAWDVVLLHASDIAAKQAAVNEYKSQLKIPELGGLMRAMVRKNELLLPAGR